MRVRISYAIDLQDIPELANKQLGEVLPELKTKAEKVSQATQSLSAVKGMPSVSAELCGQLLGDITDLRAHMSKVEQVLTDFVAILDGYGGVLINPSLEQAPEPAQVTDVESVDDES